MSLHGSSMCEHHPAIHIANGKDMVLRRAAIVIHYYALGVILHPSLVEIKRRYIGASTHSHYDTRGMEHALLSLAFAYHITICGDILDSSLH